MITALVSTQDRLGCSSFAHHLVGLADKASASRAEDPGFESRLRGIFFPGSSHTTVAIPPVGPASVYCGWVRWKVWSATSISVWQHVKLSEQIRP